MAFCPRCDADNPDGAATCSRCGSPMTAGTMVMGASKIARPKVALRVVRADGGPESVVPMKGDVMTCGREGDLALPDDPFVAGQQARFFFSGARLAVEDVGGGNGVFVRLKVERELPIGRRAAPAAGSGWCSSRSRRRSRRRRARCSGARPTPATASG